jgi:hypothetical protein
MSRFTISLFALFFVLCVGFSAAQLVRSTQTENAQRVDDFVVSPARDLATWSAYGRTWSVRLALSEVVEDNQDYYLGTLEGEETAAVSFSLLPGRGLSGMLATGDDTYWISARPVAERSFSENEADLVVFMARESAQDSAFQAQLPPFSEPRHAEETEAVDESVIEKRATITSYKVAVYFDQEWAKTSNNPWAASANTIALFNDVNAIYKAAGLRQFTIVYKHQVSNSKTTLNDMLTYWSDTMSTKKTTFQDSTFTNQLWLVGQNVGGLAYVGTTCKGATQNMNRKTAVVGLVNFSRLWTVKTIAHELGHNRGAQHQFDNQCAGSVKTGCQCSVMSYCFPAASNNPQGATNWFSPTTVSQMKALGCY